MQKGHNSSVLATKLYVSLLSAFEMVHSLEHMFPQSWTAIRIPQSWLACSNFSYICLVYFSHLITSLLSNTHIQNVISWDQIYLIQAGLSSDR